ncbi:MAG: hypothetical protein HW413_27 [Thermoleophilia bacterium]|nr:hypothetical protein [Thermoleophilia bacterium]
MTRPQVAVVTSGFPRRSETFALNELLALEAASMLRGIFATKPGDPGPAQPDARRLLDLVEVLPPGTTDEQAAEVARRAPEVDAVHAYFAHTPAAVAERAAGLLGVPFGFSVHAKDARKVGAAELGARLSAATCVIACNPDVAADLAGLGGHADLIPHGVDLQRFSSLPPPPGSLRLLAVGRLVAKKGFDVLIEAASLLRVPFSLRIVGDGPERDRLTAAVTRAGLGDRAQLVGPLTHAELPAEYAAAHVVVVPSVEDEEGDRDGLPNVVLEALASARVVVASDIAAIGSAVHDGGTGLLVPPGDPAALSQAIATLAADPARRERLGRAGRQLAEARFELDRCAAGFVRRLELAYG